MNRLSRQTRLESMLIALVQIPEGIFRVLTLCYLDLGWTNSLSAWSLKRGLIRSKHQKAITKREIIAKLNKNIMYLIHDRAESSDPYIRKEISDEIDYCITTVEKLEKEVKRLTSTKK